MDSSCFAGGVSFVKKRFLLHAKGAALSPSFPSAMQSAAQGHSSLTLFIKNGIDPKTNAVLRSQLIRR